MDQGTAEWLAWRKNGIGASDSPAILGKSPYMTRHDLWAIKTGLKAEKSMPEFLVQKGGVTEARIRADFSLFTKRNYQPRLAEHDQYKFILASLDGYDEGTKSIIEIKFVGKEKFELELIPDHHVIQVQHQMLVVGAEFVDYLYSADEGKNYKKKTIKADKLLQQEILDACIEFQKHVTEKTDPGLGPDDMHPVRERDILKMLSEWKKLEIKISKVDTLVASQKKLEKELKAVLKFNKMSGSGVCFRRSPVKGKIDYNIVPELSGVDLDRYRGESTLKEVFELEKKPALAGIKQPVEPKQPKARKSSKG